MVLCKFTALQRRKVLFTPHDLFQFPVPDLSICFSHANFPTNWDRIRELFTHCQIESIPDDRRLFESRGRYLSHSDDSTCKGASQSRKSEVKWRSRSCNDIIDCADEPKIQSDIALYASLLRWCGDAKALQDGRHFHDRIIRDGLEQHPNLNNLLMDMYHSCGASDHARALFANVYQRDPLSWKLMIKINSCHGDAKETFHLFEQMQEEGLMPDKCIFLSVLSACALHPVPIKCEQMLVRTTSCGYGSDIVVGTVLVSIHGRCGRLEEARRHFDHMPHKDTVSWNAMIAVYVQHGEGKDALQLLNQMYSEGVKGDKATFTSVLSACESSMALAKGKQIHTFVVGHGFDTSVVLGTALINMYCKCCSLQDAWIMFEFMPKYNEVTIITIFAACANHRTIAEGRWLHGYIMDSEYQLDVIVGTAIVNMYGKCSSLDDALRMFEQMPERNVFSWNAMVAACSQNGEPKNGIQIYKRMQQEAVVLNKVTFVSLLDACARQVIVESKRIHACIIGTEFEWDIVLVTALVNMYGKCGDLEDAQTMFDMIPQCDVAMWNAIIAAYCQNGQGNNSLKLYKEMQQEGVIPDRVTFVNMLSACASEAILTEGKRMHAQIVCSGFKFTIVMENALLNMYGKCGSLGEAMSIFEKMHDRDQLSLICILSACASQAALVEGLQIHAFIETNGLFSDVVIGNALVGMYGKCANLEYARRMFDTMLERDVVSWTTMIAVYAQHGHGKDALRFFQEMQQDGVIPNAVTFVNILSACSHAGLVNDGCVYFNSMTCDHGIVPNVDHYNCMIDILGRAGRLEEAENLMNKIPPTVVSWMTLLGACRYQIDVERGEHAALHVFDMDPENATPYVLLSNIYSDAGREDDAKEMMKRVRDMGLKKELSHCSVEVNGRVHKFFADDESHPQKEDIFAELQRLCKLMYSSGFVPDTKLMFYGSDKVEHMSWGSY